MKMTLNGGGSIQSKQLTEHAEQASQLRSRP